MISTIQIYASRGFLIVSFLANTRGQVSKFLRTGGFYGRCFRFFIGRSFCIVFLNFWMKFEILSALGSTEDDRLLVKTVSLCRPFLTQRLGCCLLLFICFK